MDDLLTLPGTIPGLLRRGSPVTHIDGSRVVVVELDGDDAKLPSGWAYTRLLDLDLTDATGRAHAAWWLDAACDRAGTWAGLALWRVKRANHGGALWGQWSSRGDGYFCPALATLDPNDPRLLPDGSRLVDAEALRLVCLHVAGLEVTRA